MEVVVGFYRPVSTERKGSVENRVQLTFFDFLEYLGHSRPEDRFLRLEVKQVHAENADVRFNQ